ncbi:MAG: carboxypeptidase regulatory-like domain-containing protein, partial [Acidobacteriota bacterium]
VPLAAFDARSPVGRNVIEQPGGTALDAISDRLMWRLPYRNLGTQAAPVNSWVGNFTVNISGVNPTTAATYQTGIRWFELHSAGVAAPTVFDQGTHNSAPVSGTGLNNWMGSVAQDNGGRLALGYSRSGPSALPAPTPSPVPLGADIMIAGRTSGSGTLNEGEALFFAATGTQSSSSGRWGDYSAMSVDPVDECTFWYTQQYYSASSSAIWNTRIGSFKFPACTAPPKGTISGTITNCDTGLPINGAAVNITGGFNRLTGAPGTYSAIAAPGTYSATASKVGFGSATGNGLVVTNGGTATFNACLAPIAIVGAGIPALPTGNGIIEPNECNTVNIPLSNTGANDATAVSAVLSTSSAGVTVTQPNSAYPTLTAGGAAQTNTTPFQVSTDNTVACGTSISLTLTVTYTGGGSPAVFNFTLPVGQAANPNYVFNSSSGNTISATGTLVAGSQADDAAVSVTLPAGWTSTVYGTAVASLSANTNGELQVNGTSPTTFTNTGLPHVTAPTGPRLFPYWDDLDMTAVTQNGGIFTDTTGVAPNRTFKIEWRARHFVSGQAAAPFDTNFAILLHEGTDNFEFVYATTGVSPFAGGVSATVGAQATNSGTQFTQFSFNTASLTAGQQLAANRPAGICNAGGGPCPLPPADLSITKTDGVSSVTAGGTTTYTIVASNAGPNAVVGATVTDNFPNTITSVNWTCVGAGGGTCPANGTGNISALVNLPVGGSVTFTAVANISSAATFGMSNIATITPPVGTADPNPVNNSAMDVDNICQTSQAVVDPSIETGFNVGTVWSPQTSTLFGTPVCDASCGGVGPRTGSLWAWFGGGGTTAGAYTDTLGQTMVIPAGGNATLHFYLWISGVTTPFTDVLNVKVDGTTVQTFTEPTVGEAGYTLRSINLNAFANGASHSILFQYVHASGGGNSNFHVDDITIDGIACSGPSVAGVSVSGRVTTPDGRGLRNAKVVLTDSLGNARTVTTSSFGFYEFDEVAVGESYVIGVVSKQYRFSSQLIQVGDTLTNMDFVGQE